jgi:hypothetical protein
MRVAVVARAEKTVAAGLAEGVDDPLWCEPDGGDRTNVTAFDVEAEPGALRVSVPSKSRRRRS